MPRERGENRDGQVLKLWIFTNLSDIIQSRSAIFSSTECVVNKIIINYNIYKSNIV